MPQLWNPEFIDPKYVPDKPIDEDYDWDEDE